MRQKTAAVLRPIDVSFRQLGDKVYALMDQLRQHQAAVTRSKEGEGVSSGRVRAANFGCVTCCAHRSLALLQVGQKTASVARPEMRVWSDRPQEDGGRRCGEVPELS